MGTLRALSGARRSRIYAMSRASLGPLVGALLFLAACTSSSGAAPTDTGPSNTVPVASPASETPATTEEAFELDLAQVTTTETYPDEVRVAFADEIVTSDGSQISVIDSATGESNTLTRVVPLSLGADPASGERFGSLDVGGDRTIVFESQVGDDAPRINVLSASGTRSDVGEGAHPAIRPDGSAFAFVGPSGITAMWSPVSLLGDGLDIAGTVMSMRFSPNGDRLAIAWENEGRGGITIVDLESNGFGAATELPQPTGRRYGLPSWINDQVLAVVDHAGPSDGPGSVLTVSVDDGEVLESVRLEDAIVDLDHVAGGATILVVTVAGELKWVAGGATGPIASGRSVGARW